MKKIIFKYLPMMVLGLSLASCDSDDDVEFYDIVNHKASATTFSMLDAELPTTITFTTATRTVTDVVVKVDGEEISSGVAIDNAYSFNPSISNFGDEVEPGDSFKATIFATADGKVKEFETTFEIESAASLTLLSDLYELSDSIKGFEYEVSPKLATGASVLAELKIGAKGTYTTVMASKAYDSENLEFPLIGSDYTKNDTLYVKLTATIGSLSQTVVSPVIVNEYKQGGTKSTTLNLKNNGYDIVGDSIADATGVNASLKFSNNGYDAHLEALNGLTFIEITDEDELEQDNLPVLKAAFDAGTPETVFPILKEGQRFIIKQTVKIVETIKEVETERTADFYGTIEIAELDKLIDSATDYVKINVAFEEYDVFK
jgi:hypothetical protein